MKVSGTFWEQARVLTNFFSFCCRWRFLRISHGRYVTIVPASANGWDSSISKLPVLEGALFVLEIPHRMGLQYFEALSPATIASIVAVLCNRLVTNNDVTGTHFLR